MTNIVRSVLETRLLSYTTPLNIPVAVQGIPFTNPQSGKWLEVLLIPSNTVNPTVDGIRTRETGTCQINCWGYDGEGMGDLETLAQDIANLFPVFPKFSSVSVEQTPSLLPPLVSDGYRVIPVRFRYRFDLTRS